MTVREKQMWTDLAWPTARQIDDYIYSLLGNVYPIVVVAEAYEKLPWRLIDNDISTDSVWIQIEGLPEERRNFIINECYLRYKKRERREPVTVGTVAVWTKEMASDWEWVKRSWDELINVRVPVSVYSFLNQLVTNEIVTVEHSVVVQAGSPDVHRKIELEFI